MSDLVSDHVLRSQLMQRLITAEQGNARAGDSVLPPRVIVQFWDDAAAVPTDVQRCIDSWSELKSAGFEQLLFDDLSAAHFIKKHFSEVHVLAFQKCQHPAMRSDYFRYCYILKFGGFYVDSDDVYLGGPIEPLVIDGKLRLKPLCYDISTESMRDANSSASAAQDGSLIFYTDTTPLIAPAGHPVIASALARATSNVLTAGANNRDIQALTGPGNLTVSLALHALSLEATGDAKDFEFLSDWDSVSISKWPLDYRSDERNWRNWESGNV